MKKLFIASTPDDIEISNLEVILDKEVIENSLLKNKDRVLSVVNGVFVKELKQSINVLITSNKDINFDTFMYNDEEQQLLILADKKIDLFGYNKFLNQLYYEGNNRNYFQKLLNEVTFVETDKDLSEDLVGIFELSRVIPQLISKIEDLNNVQEEMKQTLLQKVEKFLTKEFRIEFGVIENESKEKSLTISFVEDVEEKPITRLKYIINKVSSDDFRIDKDYMYSEKENDFVKPEFKSEIDSKIYSTIFLNFGTYILEKYEKLISVIEGNVKEIKLPIANYDSTLTINFVETISNNKKIKSVDSFVVETEPENFFYKIGSYLQDEDSLFLAKTLIHISSCPNFLQEEILEWYEDSKTFAEKMKSKQKKLNFKERITGFFKK